MNTVKVLLSTLLCTSILHFHFDIITTQSMLLNGLIEVICDSGSIRLYEEISLSIDKWTVYATQDALDDSLDVATEAPKACWNIPKK